MIKALKVAKQLNVKVIEDTTIRTGTFNFSENKITVNPNKVTPYIILHELGHFLYGFGCCHEHDEYIAHGIALGLANAHDIHITNADKHIIDCYAGWSSHESCGAIEQLKKLKPKRNSIHG